MRPPSEPKINRDNPNMYFIYWNHDVPVVLWDKYYPRKRIRIKKYDDINRLTEPGTHREEFAEHRRLVWKYNLKDLQYNPFEEDLLLLEKINQERFELLDKIKQQEELNAKTAYDQLPDEDKRKLFTINQACKDFIKSRVDRKLAPESISAYEGTVTWLIEGLYELEYINIPVGDLRHIHLSAALSYIAEDRDWVATTINKEIDFLMTVFNWLETEDYIIKNPSKGKFIKLPTNKTKHRWYDKDLMKQVVEAIAGNEPLLRACQFTYWLMIRSKKELRKLKIGDIDRTLKRIRFSADLSKNSTEAYRDYPPEFEQILKEMKLERFPNHFYVFGSGNGQPAIKQCGHNYFSKMFMAVKNRLELSMDYTIYGFKHTRIVHELMKGTDGYEISHMARHTDRKSTKDYMRDYDITLVNVYEPQDLKFYTIAA